MCTVFKTSFVAGKERVKIEYPCIEDLFRHVNHLVKQGWLVEELSFRTKETWFGDKIVSYFAYMIKEVVENGIVRKL